VEVKDGGWRLEVAGGGTSQGRSSAPLMAPKPVAVNAEYECTDAELLTTGGCAGFRILHTVLLVEVVVEEVVVCDPPPPPPPPPPLLPCRREAVTRNWRNHRAAELSVSLAVPRVTRSPPPLRRRR